jgi:hypothetical protein
VFETRRSCVTGCKPQILSFAKIENKEKKKKELLLHTWRNVIDASHTHTHTCEKSLSCFVELTETGKGRGAEAITVEKKHMGRGGRIFPV